MRGKENLDWLFPLLVGYIPSGIAFGVLSTAIHISWYLTIILSLVVYSGAVQSAFLGFWSIGLEPVTMFLTAFLLNLRHSLYGPHLEEHFRIVQNMDVVTVGPFLTDEVYALGIGVDRMSVSKLRKISILAYFSWTGSTALGILLTGGLPGYIIPALYLALPALFLALMVPRIKDKSTVIAAVLSVLVSAFFELEGLPEYFMLLAMIVGITSGILSNPELRRSLR